MDRLASSCTDEVTSPKHSFKAARGSRTKDTTVHKGPKKPFFPLCPLWTLCEVPKMAIATRKEDRTSLALGWEAARANAVPAFILQGAMLAVLISYYLSPACADFLNRLAHYKERHGLAFVVIAAVLAGAIVPELFVIVS